MGYNDDKGPKPNIPKLNPNSDSMEALRLKFASPKTQFDIIVKTMTEDADESHLEQFLYACKNLDLDPVMGQIYMQVRWSWNWKANPKRWDRHLSVQTGIEGLRSLAERQQDYAGQDVPKFYWDNGTGGVAEGPVFPNGAEVLAVTVTIHRYLGQNIGKVAFSHTAYLRDYAQRTSNGSLSGMWEKVGIMLPKCAEAGAFRKGWPQVFKNLYIREEMQAETVPEVKQEAAGVPVREEAKDAGPKDGKGGAGTEVPAPQAAAGEVGAVMGPGEEPEKRPAAPLTTQQKATEIVNALRDKYKEQAGLTLKEYVSKSAGVKNYSDVPKAFGGSLIDLLHVKLKAEGPEKLVEFLEAKPEKETEVEQPK